MKCPTCQKREMIKKQDSIKQDNVMFEAYACPACGEEIMTMKQLKVLADKYRSLRKAKEITFARWGNSMAMRIPSDIAQEFQITEGKHAFLTKDKKGIRIIPIA